MEDAGKNFGAKCRMLGDLDFDIDFIYICSIKAPASGVTKYQGAVEFKSVLTALRTYSRIILAWILNGSSLCGEGLITSI